MPKISALAPVATPLTGVEPIPVVQGGETRGGTVNHLVQAAYTIALRQHAEPDFALETEQQYRRAVDRYREYDAAARAFGGPLVWCDASAPGGGNGSSLANAFTDPKAAALAAGPGGIVALNGTFPIASIVDPALPDYVTFDGGLGPQRAMFSGLIKPGDYVAAGGGVFSRPAPAGGTAAMAYNLRPDDQIGTATGVNVLTGPKGQFITRRGIVRDRVRAHFGALKKAAVATMAPAAGEWSETGGVQYARPFGAPTLAQVNAMLGYARRTHGFLFQKTGAKAKGVILRHFDTFFTPSDVDGEGYGWMIVDPENCVAFDIYDIMAGDHGQVFYETERGNISLDCVSVQLGGRASGSGAANAFTVYANTHQPQVDAILARPTQIAFPLLNENGFPLRLNYSVNAALSHTNGGANKVGGIAVVDPGQIDFLHQISVKSGAIFNVGGGGASDDDTPGSFVQALNLPDVIDEAALGFADAGFTVKVYGGTALGLAALPNRDVEHRGTVIDPLDEGQTDDIGLAFNAFGAVPVYVRFLGGLWKSGPRRRVMSGMRAMDKIWLGGADLLNEGADDTINPSFIHVTHTAAGRIDLTSCTIDGKPLTSRMLIQASGSLGNGWAAVAAVVRSNGGNIFGQNLTQFIGSEVAQTAPTYTPKDAAWWQANIAGGTSDLTGHLNPTGLLA